MFKFLLKKLSRFAIWAFPLAVATLFVACSGAGLKPGNPDQSGDLPRYGCVNTDKCKLEYCDQVLIPSGEFLMGSNSQGEVVKNDQSLFYEGNHTPAHPVYLDAYCLDKYEVTYERYLDCVRAGVCDPSGHHYADGETDESLLEGTVYVNHYPETCGENPLKRIEKCPHHAVNCKSYEQAKTYCEWIGRRLCTEAEWERFRVGCRLLCSV